MTLVAALAPPRRPLWLEIYRRQPALAAFAAVLLPLFVLALLAAGLDPRTLDGAPVWAKPAKFLLSIGLFSATAAWFFGYMDEAARRSRLARGSAWLMIGSGAFELAYITLQAARGEPSHFNDSSTFHSVMYGLMGVASLTLTGPTLALAWLVARRPRPGVDPAFRLSVVLGLVMTFVLGAGFGGYMGAGDGHFVGADAGVGLPLFGALAAAWLGGRRAVAAVWVFAALYAAFNAAVFLQALADRPFLAL